jgi:5-bromo-4-chloroindolyl phosphate hydrolysis protein
MEFDAWEVIAIIFMYMTLSLLFLALKIWVIVKIVKSAIGGVIDGIKGSKVSELSGSEEENDPHGFAHS